MNKYLIITTSLIDKNYDSRKRQYTRGIQTAKKLVPSDYKIIIVENNGKRDTFLDNFELDVFYTNNNKDIVSGNKGKKELQDIKDIIQHYNIKDDDFIVKLTGRYFIQDNSDYFSYINKDIDFVGKFGNYSRCKPNPKSTRCGTGMVGMRVKYIKNIPDLDEDTHLEDAWGKLVCECIEPSRAIKLDILNLLMAPGCNLYRLV